MLPFDWILSEELCWLCVCTRRLALVLDVGIPVDELITLCVLWGILVVMTPWPCFAVMPPWLSLMIGDWYLSNLFVFTFVG